MISFMFTQLIRRAVRSCRRVLFARKEVMKCNIKLPIRCNEYDDQIHVSSHLQIENRSELAVGSHANDSHLRIELKT